MGLLLNIRGADFSGAAVAYVPKAPRAAEHYNFFGGSADPGRNLIAGKPQGQVIGAPAAGVGFASFQGATHFVRTGILDQAAVTLLAVARAPNLQTSTFGFIIANYNGTGAAAGSNMLISSGLRKMEAYGARDVDGAPRVVEKEVDTGINAWAFYAVRIGAAYHRIDDKTNGRFGAGPVAFARSAPNGIPYLIGSSNGGVQGLVDIAFAGIHSVELTDAEIELNYQAVKAALALKSIIV